MNRRDAVKTIYIAAGAALFGSAAIAEPNDGFVLKGTTIYNGKTWQHFSKTVYMKSDAKDVANRIIVMSDENLSPFVCDCTVRVEKQYFLINGKKEMSSILISPGQTVEGYYMEEIQDAYALGLKTPVKTTMTI